MDAGAQDIDHSILLFQVYAQETGQEVWAAGSQTGMHTYAASAKGSINYWATEVAPWRLHFFFRK